MTAKNVFVLTTSHQVLRHVFDLDLDLDLEIILFDIMAQDLYNAQAIKVINAQY